MHGRIVFHLSIAAVAAGLALGTAPEAAAKPDRVTVLTGSPGGTWYPKGAALAEIFSRYGVKANAEVGAALSNVAKLAAGQGELGLTYNIVPPMARNAEAPFNSKITSTRAVAALFQSWHHIGVRKETGIESIRGLKGKPYASQAVGNASQVAFAQVLQAYGLSEEALELSRGSQAYGANSTKDRKVVGWAAISAVPTGLWAEAFATVDMSLLGISEDAFNKIKQMNDGWVYSKIPAGTYRGVTEDVPVLSAFTILVTDAGVPADDVEWMVKTLLDNLGEFRQVHASLRNMTPASMADVVGVELHPGAKRAYQEAGAL